MRNVKSRKIGVNVGDRHIKNYDNVCIVLPFTNYTRTVAYLRVIVKGN